jgi:hypothetical protein
MSLKRMEMDTTSSIRPKTSSALLNGSDNNNNNNNINASVRGGLGLGAGFSKNTSTKQVSFRGDILIPLKKDESTTAALSNNNNSSSSNNNNNNDPKKQTTNYALSDRSMDSLGSRESHLSREESGTSIPSLGSRLLRTQKNRDPLKYYEVIKVMGDGSMGSVSKVKKRKSALGGSARKAFVDENKRDHILQTFPCLSFCFPGIKERKREDSFITTVDSIDSNDVDTMSAITDGNSATTTSKTSGVTEDESENAVRGTNGKAYRKASSMISYGSDISVVYALKSIILDRVMDSTFRKELLNEIQVLRSIDHPNIVKAIETFDYQNRIYLVLELCNGGDLYARDPYTETQAMGITYSLLDAIAYLHSKDITHRDLKYENIMFSSPTSSTVKVRKESLIYIYIYV